MADQHQLEFFLLRYVPDAVKNEFVNIGMVMLEGGAGGTRFAEVRFTRDWRRVRCLDPGADVDMLQALERDIRGQLREGSDRDVLLKRVKDSFSNLVQISATKACLADDPAKEMETLAHLYFDGPKRGMGREASGRQRVFKSMRDAFEQAGVWALMRKEIAVEAYTHKGDPLKIDCGYRPNGVVKMFQAVSLAGGVDAAKALAFSYPQIANGIRIQEQAASLLVAVVEDDIDRADDAVGFALETLRGSGIAVAAAREMAGFAEMARRELRV